MVNLRKGRRKTSSSVHSRKACRYQRPNQPFKLSLTLRPPRNAVPPIRPSTISIRVSWILNFRLEGEIKMISVYLP